MTTRQVVHYEGIPCKVLAMMENACILARPSGAQFTVSLADPAITVHEVPTGEAGLHLGAADPSPGDAQDVLDNLSTDDEAFEDENDYRGMGWVGADGRP